MAEWFKAADLRPAISDAWVRTPLSAKFSSTFHKSGKAAMAEWFKAADLRPAINDAWVRTPLAAMSCLSH